MLTLGLGNEHFIRLRFTWCKLFGFSQRRASWRHAKPEKPDAHRAAHQEGGQTSGVCFGLRLGGTSRCLPRLWWRKAYQALHNCREWSTEGEFITCFEMNFKKNTIFRHYRLLGHPKTYKCASGRQSQVSWFRQKWPYWVFGRKRREQRSNRHTDRHYLF